MAGNPGAFVGAIAAVTVQTHIRNQQNAGNIPSVPAAAHTPRTRKTGAEELFGIGPKALIGFTVFSALSLVAMIACIVFGVFN